MIPQIGTPGKIVEEVIDFKKKGGMFYKEHKIVREYDAEEFLRAYDTEMLTIQKFEDGMKQNKELLPVIKENFKKMVNLVPFAEQNLKKLQKQSKRERKLALKKEQDKNK